MSRKRTGSAIAAQLRKALKDGGSAEHAESVQWFFKNEIKSHGWYTAALRRAARSVRKEILKDHDFGFLVRVADELFSGTVLEEKIFGVFLLEKLETQCADAEFKLFESWVGRISSWADHDALVHDLNCADGGDETRTGIGAVPLGKVEASMASAGGMCCAGSRNQGKDVFSRDHENVRHAVGRRG